MGVVVGWGRGEVGFWEDVEWHDCGTFYEYWVTVYKEFEGIWLLD